MAKDRDGWQSRGRVALERDGWLSRMMGGKAEGVWQSEGWVAKERGWVAKQKEGG